MNWIVLSADNRPTLCLAPDEVAQRLEELAIEFLEEIHRPDSPSLRAVTDSEEGTIALIHCYDETDFVAWLNQGKQAPEERITPVAQSISFARPDAWRSYPWFNF